MNCVATYRDLRLEQSRQLTFEQCMFLEIMGGVLISKESFIQWCRTCTTTYQPQNSAVSSGSNIKSWLQSFWKHKCAGAPHIRILVDRTSEFTIFEWFEALYEGISLFGLPSLTVGVGKIR